MSWSKQDLIELLDRRVDIAARRDSIDDLKTIKDLLPGSNQTRGNALEYLLNRTLMRPRDAISLLNHCLSNAGGGEKLTWKDIHAGEFSYSEDRLLALRDEWKPTYPGIDTVIRMFAGTPGRLDVNAMQERLNECILLTMDPQFKGVEWMTECGAKVWESGTRDWAEQYQSLIRLLYNIGFIGCISGKNAAVYGHDVHDFVDRLSNLRAVERFVVHPAFRPALDIRD